MNRTQAEQLLQEIFHIEKFYDRQWETIEKLFKEEKVLLIEKTGFGKSLCFQFPAVIFQGMTVVFSPLLSLMRDQIKKLNSLGIVAKSVNSEQTPEENDQVIEEAKQGKIKILYIAPERQENQGWIEATRSMNLSMIVIDEAHCISVWGHDFRPAFKRIINLVKLLPKDFPILATTATATRRVEQDIAKQIGEGITVVRGNLIRENLKLFVVLVSSEDEKLIWLGKNLHRLPQTGILYTGTRVDTEIYTKWFEFLGISAIAYNAGLDPETRIAIENGLMNNQWKCVISTNALGMGIDKPDIRFIIHTQIPQSPIHYYQEIGRAGRDGQPSYIILFYNPADKDLPMSFIEGARPSLKKYEKVIQATQLELLGERELAKYTNLKQTQIRVIKADLIEQGIIREVMLGKNKKYEYIPGAPPLQTETFEALRQEKLKELESMIGYVYTDMPRMKYLCDYLGDEVPHQFTNCDNTEQGKIKVNITPEWIEKLKSFREDYFPELVVEKRGSHMVNGVAASYYGVSSVGEAIHRSKYEQGGDFPDFLVSLAVKAFYRKFSEESFDWVLYVPPTKSGDLVKNFATKVAQIIGVPISHHLKKIRVTEEQKVFENGYSKTANVHDAFAYTYPEEIEGKQILLIDDVFDSGATIKEIGKLLTSLGAVKIAPLVIAKTVNGDLRD